MATQLPSTAANLGAKALSEGNTIAFDPTTMDFDSPEGRQLLAHEIAHILQRRRQTNPPKKEWPDPQGEGSDSAQTEEKDSDRESLEREAEEAAAQAVRGAAVRTIVGKSVPNRMFSGLKDLWERGKEGGQRAQAEVKQVLSEPLPDLGLSWQSQARSGIEGMNKLGPNNPIRKAWDQIEKAAGQQGGASSVEQLATGVLSGKDKPAAPADPEAKGKEGKDALTTKDGQPRDLLPRLGPGALRQEVAGKLPFGMGVLGNPDLQKALRSFGKGRPNLSPAAAERLARLIDRVPNLQQQLEEARKQLQQMSSKDLDAAMQSQLMQLLAGVDRIIHMGAKLLGAYGQNAPGSQRVANDVSSLAEQGRADALDGGMGEKWPNGQVSLNAALGAGTGSATLGIGVAVGAQVGAGPDGADPQQDRRRRRQRRC
ncbi:MAG: DUF4157 domain-containing protein [Myxococcales bacterium]|nr:DUF4157 domain-containing protein [Myxococcota bacterium]MDW8281555.1 DUF4157 domain-containing protein [Myxococcales bacterium]